MSDLPRVYVTRRLPKPALELLARHTQLATWSGELPPPRAVLLKAARDVDGLLTLPTEHVDAILLASATRLQVVSNYAVTYDNIDLAAATRQGVLVTHLPDVQTETTADFTLALMLAAARRVIDGAAYVKGGMWRAGGPETLLGRDLAGATLGIVGMGRIGQAVARRVHGFGVRLVYAAPTRKPEVDRAYGALHVPFDDLLQQSDFITLHCPLNDTTYHLIDRDALNVMRPDVVLVNTARGQLVDTRALAEALRHRPMVAALDVTDPEPLPANHPLLTLPNVIVSPNMASASAHTRTRMALLAAENLLTGLRGERPHGLVNPEVLREYVVGG